MSSLPVDWLARVFVVLAGVFLLSSGSKPEPVSPAPSSPARKVDVERLEAVREVVADAMKRGVVPGGVVAVGTATEVVFMEGFGNSVVVPQTHAASTATLYDLASLTKPIATSAAVMKLVDEGRISLDDPVAKYIPEWDQFGKGDATVRHLLTHSSGITFDPGSARTVDADNPNYRAELILRLAEFPASFPPGSRFFYTDGAMIIAGELVERVTGERLDEFVRKEIFVPLKMENTTYRPLLHGVEKERIAATTPELWGVVHDATARRMGGVSGHAGLFSTAEDLARFAQMILSGGVIPGTRTRLLKAETVEQWTSVQLNAGGKLRAIGWDIDTEYSTVRGNLPVGAVGHTGFTGTSIWIDPARGYFVVVLTNRLHPSAAPRSEWDAFVAEISNVVASAFGLAGEASAAAVAEPLPAEPPLVEPFLIEENDPRIQIEGPWSSANIADYSGGRYVYSISPAASITLRFEGSHVTLWHGTSPALGKAVVFLDGERWMEIDMYTPALNRKARTMIASDLGPGEHVLEIRPAGEKNPSSTGLAVVVDAFEIR